MSLLILDRDGVINHDSADYIKSAAEWLPIAGSIDAIAQLSQAGFDIAIATNQSGLSRGLFTLDDLEAMHAKLCQLVEEAGGTIAGIFYCPHLPEEGCDCRKPATGLLRSIEAELGLRVAGAPFIGDSLKDLQAAERAQCQPILVTTGKGAQTLKSLHSGLRNAAAVKVFDNLSDAAAHLLQHGP